MRTTMQLFNCFQSVFLINRMWRDLKNRRLYLKLQKYLDKQDRKTKDIFRV